MTAPRTLAAEVTTRSPETIPPPGRLDLPFIKTGKKLTGAARMEFAKKVVAAYRTPGRTVTIREICEATNRSYGAIHSLLSEARATKRGRRTAGTEEQVSS
ncbi:helix-turn-helix domain-containing protein [Streptomyces sp. NPDC006237]|uniref:helix-turn-helix domain-containing protein n=1 Tax=Streptomyces sp. NPDC006237 TaxID=3154474 RepID=UPI0033B85A8B